MTVEQASRTQDTQALAEDLLASVELDPEDREGVWPGLLQATAALQAETDLSDAGWQRAVAMFRDNLNRLAMIGRDRKRHPEIVEQEIKAPIFILGLPRCGTSLLHALMGADPDIRTPLMWEVAAPSPPPQAATFDSDPRIAAFDNYADSEFVGEWEGVRKAHPIGARIPQECGMILETAFTGANPVMLFRLPGFYQWYKEADTRFGYRVHRKWLQHLQWRNPRRRWVLKVQEHMYHLPELLSVYPDAVFVQPHRDPQTVLASISRLIEVIRSVSFEHQDRRALGREMLHLWHDGQVKMMAYRKQHPDLPVYDMRFKDLVADPVAAVKGIYEHYGLDFTPEAEAGVNRWWRENPADKHGKHSYQLSDYDLTEAEIREVYADYIDTYRDYL